MGLDDLRDLNDAAAELGIVAVTLRAAIARGRFKARKFGNAWVTTTDEIERYRRDSLGQVGRPGADISEWAHRNDTTGWALLARLSGLHHDEGAKAAIAAIVDSATDGNHLAALIEADLAKDRLIANVTKVERRSKIVHANIRRSGHTTWDEIKRAKGIPVEG